MKASRLPPCITAPASLIVPVPVPLLENPTIITAECTYSLDVVEQNGPAGECEDTLLLGSIEIGREKGKPRVHDISKIFRASGCLDVDESGVCDSGDLEFRNVWIFNIEELVEYFWDYDNNGLKLLQLRFYETTSGYIGTVK